MKSRRLDCVCHEVSMCVSHLILILILHLEGNRYCIVADEERNGSGAWVLPSRQMTGQLYSTHYYT